MLKVTIELVPHGHLTGRRIIATAAISQVNKSADGNHGDYSAFFTVDGGAFDAEVKRYPRIAAWDMPWLLVKRALENAHIDPREEK